MKEEQQQDRKVPVIMSGLETVAVRNKQDAEQDVVYPKMF